MAERVAAGEKRSPCAAAALQTAVEAVGVDVVISASSVGSGALQGDAAEQKPVPECLLKSTEAISSSRLYSNTHTSTYKHRTQRGRERWHLRDNREKRNPKTQH